MGKPLSRTITISIISFVLFSVVIILIGKFVLHRQSSNNTVPINGKTPSLAPIVGKQYDGVYGVEVKEELTPELVDIPGGTFTMGTTDEEGSSSERPPHKVTVDKFSMSRFEITNAQFIAFCRATNYVLPNDPNWKGIYAKEYPDFPIVNITFQEATDYCKWLSSILGREVRLPTEAEWEYAAQGSVIGTNIDTTSGKLIPTTQVGSYAPNQYGLYDMLGNVSEWCSDWFDVNYYASSPENNPTGPTEGTTRVLRGGSWSNTNDGCRITYRSRGNPTGDSPTTGFRVVVR